MFHIVFSGDENYLKYTAVCITSIVRNTDTSKVFADFLTPIEGATDNIASSQTDTFATASDILADSQKMSTINSLHDSLQNSHTPTNPKEEYIFHILTDYISENIQEKFATLASELNALFPTQIITHIVNGDDFIGQPPWRNSYLAYYRIKMGKVLSTDIEEALYLDGDTLVNCDIRELFAVDLKNTICAVAANVCPMVYNLDARFDDTKFPFKHGRYYFNSGVMLMNLKEWRAQDIESKTFQFLHKYITRAPDQDALNAVIYQNLTQLPYKWNMMIHNSYPPESTINIDESPNYNNQHTKQDYLAGVASPKIIHYAMKPWNGKGLGITAAYKPYYFPNFDLWWDMAKNTPVFHTELEAVKESPRYKKKVQEEDALEKIFSSSSFSLARSWFKFKRESRPLMRKIEAPFKKIRNKIRAKKLKQS